MRSESPREFWRKARHLLAGRAFAGFGSKHALLVDSLAGHQWQLTLELWHSLHLFNRWRRGQLWREAQLCFVNLQANKDGQGVQPNLRTFNTMLGVYEKASAGKLSR